MTHNHRPTSPVLRACAHAGLSSSLVPYHPINLRVSFNVLVVATWFIAPALFYCSALAYSLFFLVPQPPLGLPTVATPPSAVPPRLPGAHSPSCLLGDPPAHPVGRAPPPPPRRPHPPRPELRHRRYRPRGHPLARRLGGRWKHWWYRPPRSTTEDVGRRRGGGCLLCRHPPPAALFLSLCRGNTHTMAVKWRATAGGGLPALPTSSSCRHFCRCAAGVRARRRWTPFRCKVPTTATRQ